MFFDPLVESSVAAYFVDQGAPDRMLSYIKPKHMDEACRTADIAIVFISQLMPQASLIGECTLGG